MPKDQQEALIEALLRVETLSDTRELIRLLRVSTS
jgi:hypothetical protein